MQLRLSASGLGHSTLRTPLREKRRRDNYPYFSDKEWDPRQLGDLAKAKPCVHVSVSELGEKPGLPSVGPECPLPSVPHSLYPAFFSLKQGHQWEDRQRRLESLNFFAQLFSEMRQQIQVPPYWNNEIDHLSKSSHLIEAKRTIDTVCLSPRNKILKGKGLKWMKMYPMHNQMKMLWARGQGLSANWISFSALNLTSWDSFFFFLPPFSVSIIFFNLLKGRDFLFNGKSVFHHKDGTQCAWFSQSPGKQILCVVYVWHKRKTFQQVYFRNDSLESCIYGI